LVTVQRDLESKRAELAALKLTLDTVVADLATEQISHRGTRDTLLTTQHSLPTTNNNLTAALLNTVVVNTQMVTVRQELDSAATGDLSDMSCPTFSVRELDDAVLHVRTFKIWLNTKKLPARAAALHGLLLDEERLTAEISYFASSLRDSATLWFNNLVINVDIAYPARTIGNLTELCAAFHESCISFSIRHRNGVTLQISLRQGRQSEKSLRSTSDESRRMGLRQGLPRSKS